MKTLTATIAMAVVTLACLPSQAPAQVDYSITGGASLELRLVDGERESAKFNEYRDLTDGATGSLELDYRRKDGYFLELEGLDIGLENQHFRLEGGRRGKYRVELVYDELPHRFALDAPTLYGGVGSGNLVLSGNFQDATSANELAARTRAALAGASAVDLELFRKTVKLNADLMALDPFNFRLEFRREEREGTRPLFGSFGFGNTVEIFEPIDYETTELRLIAEYSQRPFHVSASYTLSIFENNIDTLSFDNPFRAVDSTEARAYVQTFVDGPSRGVIDLYPDNRAHNFTLTASVSDLPLRTRVSATASWGWWEQDDDFVPLTSNTAIRTGAVSGLPGIPVPCDAFDVSCLARRRAEGEVQTSLYKLQVTSRPADRVGVKARYRYYEYDNDSEPLELPGHVRMDAVWEPEEELSVTSSYKRHTAGVDLDFDVLTNTRLGLGYTYEKTKRVNREVEDQDEHIGKVSADTRPLDWLNLRLSYERSQRRGDYKFDLPFLAVHIDEEPGAPTPQLPFLRKYDQAERDRDQVRFLAAVYPTEAVSLSGSVGYARDDYGDSAFGLVESEQWLFGLDGHFAPTERLTLFAFYSFERFDGQQKARQWTPGGTGDPFLRETGLESPSNWTAENIDDIHTVGGGIEYTLIPKRLDAKINYSYSKSNGKVRLASPVGSPDNNAFAPLDFDEVDDIDFHVFHVRLRYHLRGGLSVAVGYVFEQYDVDDFALEGLQNVPTTTTGAYNAALLAGTLPKSYDASIVYLKLSYVF